MILLAATGSPLRRGAEEGVVIRRASGGTVARVLGETCEGLLAPQIMEARG